MSNYFNLREKGEESPVKTLVPAAIGNAGQQTTHEDGSNPAVQALGLLDLNNAGMGIDFPKTKALALAYCDEILEQWLPDGEQRGLQYVALNPQRNDSELGSFQIKTDTGIWCDFASGDKGGDLISLVHYVGGYAFQAQAAVKILELIAGQPSDATVRQARHEAKVKTIAADEFTAIMPIPADARNKPIFFGHELGTPSMTWEYRNECGQVMFYVNRFETIKGKTTRPLTYGTDSSGHTMWKLKAPPTPRPAYGLDRLATKPEAPVLFTEGEKTADAAQRLLPGFVAVTTMNGAQSPEKTDFSPFAGRKVYIAPDNDEAGAIYRDKLIGLLTDAGAEVVAVLRLETFAKADGTLEQAYDLADAEVEGWTTERLLALGDSLWISVPTETASRTTVVGESEISVSSSTPVDQTELDYDVGDYQVRDHGVLRPVRDQDGEITHYTSFCSRVDVISYTRNHESNRWGKELQFKDPDGNVKRWVLPAEQLASSGDSYRSVLLNMGLAITPGATNSLALASYLAMAKPKARALSVVQPGWFKSVFVLPDAAYGLSDERVVFQGKSPDDVKRFATAGTLESWQQHVATPCIGNSRAALAICIGLASPLLALLNEDNGGFHYRGNSSSGKTVCLAVGSSVWGGSSLIRTWNMTVNGLEGVAAMHNDVLLPLDELGQANPITASEAAYMLGNGQGKSRADRTGEGQSVKRFRNLVLSSGEKSLHDMMAQIGQSSMAGQEVRMVEISADAGAGFGVFENIHGAKTSQVFAETLRQSAHQHHGHAGRAFVEKLVDVDAQAGFIEQLRGIMQSFVDDYVPQQSTGQVGRVGRRFGLVAAAGELAIQLGILPWPAGEAKSAASKCLADWIEQRGGIGNQEEEKTLRQIRRFIELHGDSRFTPLHEGIETSSSDKTFNRAGYRKAGDDGRTEYLIFGEVYRTEVCAGLNSEAATKILIDNNLIYTEKTKTGKLKPQVQRRISNVERARVYHLKADILGSQLENEETGGRRALRCEKVIKYNI